MSTANESRRVRWAYAEYEKGQTVAQVAVRMGISMQSLHKLFVRHGLKCRPAGWSRKVKTPDMRRMTMKRSRAGHRVSDIAKGLGVSESVIYQVRRENGFAGVRKGRSTAPGRRHHRFDASGEITHKWCARCSSMVKRARFWRNSASIDGLQSQCCDCQRASRRQRAARPNSSRDAS